MRGMGKPSRKLRGCARLGIFSPHRWNFPAPHSEELGGLTTRGVCLATGFYSVVAKVFVGIAHFFVLFRPTVLRYYFLSPLSRLARPPAYLLACFEELVYKIVFYLV